jgi:phosphoglycolate phosphatase-like HAD superfamily hydrolase
MKLKRAIIYDFDGVICDSVNVKTEAFAEMYKPYGDHIVSQVVNYHLLNGGISRYEKFKYFHYNFLGINLDNAQVGQMAEQFASLVMHKVIISEFIPGSFEFIKSRSENYLQFVCTGTPESEILEILDRRNLLSFFNGIYGSPQKKAGIIKRIASEFNIGTKEMIFFGDSMTDYDAALEMGVDFLGIINEHTVFPEGTTLIEDFYSEQLNHLLPDC